MRSICILAAVVTALAVPAMAANYNESFDGTANDSWNPSLVEWSAYGAGATTAAPVALGRQDHWIPSALSNTSGGLVNSFPNGHGKILQLRGQNDTVAQKRTWTQFYGVSGGNWVGATTSPVYNEITVSFDILKGVLGTGSPGTQADNWYWDITFRDGGNTSMPALGWHGGMGWVKTGGDDGGITDPGGTLFNLSGDGTTSGTWDHLSAVLKFTGATTATIDYYANGIQLGSTANITVDALNHSIGAFEVLIQNGTGAEPDGPAIGVSGNLVWTDNFSVMATPEPATLALLALGALPMLRRRRPA